MEPNAWWWWQRTSCAESSMQQIWSGSISLQTRYGRWSWRLLQTFPGFGSKEMDVALSATHPYQCYKHDQPLPHLASRLAHMNTIAIIGHHCLFDFTRYICLFCVRLLQESWQRNSFSLFEIHWSLFAFWTRHSWPPSYTQGWTVRSRCQEASNISNMDSRKKSALTKLTSTSRCRKAIAWKNPSQSKSGCLPAYSNSPIWKGTWPGDMP